MILVLPIVQLLVLPLAADYEIKNINISIVDHDQSSYSRELIDKIGSSGYFRISSFGASYQEAYSQFETDESDLILEIPEEFEKELINGLSPSLFLAVNAINGTKASVGSGYLSSIIMDFNGEIALKAKGTSISGGSVIEAVTSNRFNPLLNYRFFMVPGIMVVLVTMVGAYMCSLNIVKEKEAGTIEQINVSPIRKHHFILGKVIPFWIIGMLVFSVGLFVIARLVYGIVPLGSVVLLYLFLGIYLVAILGIGLLISTYSSTQQQAMSLAFFCMMIFMLMSGLFTSVDSMPMWAQWIARLNPVTYFIEVVRMIILKGSGFSDIRIHLLIMIAFAGFFNLWAIANYRKTS